MPQAAVLTAPRTLIVEDRPPLTPAPGEVRVRVQRAGVCGTDLALFSGDYPVPLPLVCGHEFVGTVEQLGGGVPAHWRGRRVVAEINNTCTAYRRPDPCRACRMQMPGHCQQRTVTGIIKKDGAFAEQVTVPAGALHAVPESLSSAAAVLCEPLAAAMQTFEMTPAQAGQTVVVLGPGRLGILIVFAAVQQGLTVLAVARSEAKRRRALAFGAQAALLPEAARAWVDEHTEGLGADLVVDATGTAEGITQALALVRPRGVVSVKSTCGLPAEGFDTTRLVVDEVRLQGSRCGPFAPALELLDRHQKQLQTLITRVRPLAEAQAAVESAFAEDKVVLEMSGSES